MYLRHTTRRKDGKTHTYWQLVRSVRVGRKVIQQTVAHLGELDAQGRARAKALARAILRGCFGASLFGVSASRFGVRASGSPRFGVRLSHLDYLFQPSDLVTKHVIPL